MKRLSITKSYNNLPNKKNKTHPDFITKQVYKNINDCFNKSLFEALLITGDEFNLPERLGTLRFIKFKPKNPSIDFAASKKHGMRIVHDNYHSDGYAVKLRWDKSKANFKNKRIWDLHLVRHHLRLNELSVKNYIMKHGVSQFLENTIYYANN